MLNQSYYFSIPSYATYNVNTFQRGNVYRIITECRGSELE